MLHNCCVTITCRKYVKYIGHCNYSDIVWMQPPFPFNGVALLCQLSQTLHATATITLTGIEGIHKHDWLVAMLWYFPFNPNRLWPHSAQHWPILDQCSNPKHHIWRASRLLTYHRVFIYRLFTELSNAYDVIKYFWGYYTITNMSTPTLVSSYFGDNRNSLPTSLRLQLYYYGRVGYNNHSTQRL